VPVLFNASLDLRREPIVATPRDALNLFVQRPLDVLVLKDRLVRKYTPWAEARRSRACCLVGQGGHDHSRRPRRPGRGRPVRARGRGANRERHGYLAPLGRVERLELTISRSLL
jgi:hypothetical protein